MRLTGARVLLVSLILLSALIPSAWADTAFTDGFEAGGAAWDDLWDGNGVTAWTQGQVGEGEAGHSPHGGANDAWAANGAEGLITSDDVDLSGVSSASLSFWYYLDDNEAADLTLLLWDGLVYDTIAQIGGGTESTWLYYEIASLDSQYFITNFRIRFNAVLGSGENCFVDDVLVEYATGPNEYSRSASQSVTVASSISRFSEFSRSAAQGVAWTGAAARVLEFTRAAAQGVTWGGATLSELIYGRTASQTIGWASGTARIIDYARAATQSILWDGTINRVIDITRIAQQTMNITMSSGRLSEMFRSATQSIVAGVSGWGGMGYLYDATASLVLYVKTMDPPANGGSQPNTGSGLFIVAIVFLSIVMAYRDKR